MAILTVTAPNGRIAELNRLLFKARAERAEKDVIIRWLEQQLVEASGKSSPQQVVADVLMNSVAQLTELQANLSVRQLSAVILAAQPEGLTIPALLLELRKRGWQSNSENPANIVNSILNRTGRPFRRMGDRWFHENFFQQEPSGPTAAPSTTEVKEATPAVNVNKA
jgi:hypothetical protein